MNKFNAKKVTIDDHTFYSQREGARYVTLKRLQEQGAISGLELQPVFVLAPGVLVPGEKRKRPALRYVADFRYQLHGAVMIEDVKGVQTPLFRVKLHLLALLPGWGRSRGACAEVAQANELGIPCFPLRDVVLGEHG